MDISRKPKSEQEQFKSEALDQSVEQSAQQSPEVPAWQEASRDHSAEKPETSDHHIYAEEIASEAVAATQQIAQVVKPKSETLQAIEQILEDDLQALYASMDASKQQQFKQEGEKTANAIEVLLQQVKVNVGKIFDLIFAWLKLLPGVNRFFLRQTAKIKAERIMRLNKPK